MVRIRGGGGTHEVLSTTSVADADFDVSATDRAVMVTVPAASPVTVPFVLSDATAGLLELHVTAWFAVDGRIQAVNANVNGVGHPDPIWMV